MTKPEPCGLKLSPNLLTSEMAVRNDLPRRSGTLWHLLLQTRCLQGVYPELQQELLAIWFNSFQVDGLYCVCSYVQRFN